MVESESEPESISFIFGGVGAGVYFVNFCEVGVYLVIFGGVGVGAGVYNFQTHGVGAGVYNFQTLGVGVSAGAGVYTLY